MRRKQTLAHEGSEGKTGDAAHVRGKTPPSGGWPDIPVNLKTLLETGDATSAAEPTSSAAASE